jgi:hypothetical protein
MWLATVTIESDSYKYPDNSAEKNSLKNADRFASLNHIVKMLAGRHEGDGIILFPGGYFHTGVYDVEPAISEIADRIRPVLKEVFASGSATIIVCIGIDGKVILEEGDSYRYDANQVAIAVSKDGLVAFAKKFHPTDPVEKRILDLAADYCSKEFVGGTLYSRTFSIDGKTFYLAECNDIKGLKNYSKPATVDCILNCVHGCYNRSDGPTCSYFVRLNFAGASQCWRCPVFGAVVFFKRQIAEKWRTGMFYRTWDKTPIQCGTDENALAPYQSDTSVMLDGGYAQVDVYDLDAVFSGNPVFRLSDMESHTKSHVTSPRRPVMRPSANEQSKEEAVLLFNRLQSGLGGICGDSIMKQKTKVTFRGKNTIGYPEKSELDMITLFQPTTGNKTGIRFRIYPHVLAGHLHLKDAEKILENLPGRLKTGQERENPHQGEIYIDGHFVNSEEVQKFVEGIKLRIKNAMIMNIDKFM